MVQSPPRVIRIGAVSYLNTLPLIDGLENLADIALQFDVPSRLLDRLLTDDVDVALCSAFDYQSSPQELSIIGAGLLGCDGSTMTVRLFSQAPIKRIERIYCDTDSHTSVNLLRLLLHECHGIKPELINFDARKHVANTEGSPIDWPESMLLIGDKVVTDATPAIRYPYQLDLGAEWSELTGLPFVFATWMMKKPKPGDDEAIHLAEVAGAILDHQRRHNLERIDSMLNRKCGECGWPIDLAGSYVTEMIEYEWTDRAEAGLKRFFERCYDLGLIDENRPIKFIG